MEEEAAAKAVAVTVECRTSVHSSHPNTCTAQPTAGDDDHSRTCSGNS